MRRSYHVAGFLLVGCVLLWLWAKPPVYPHAPLDGLPLPPDIEPVFAFWGLVVLVGGFILKGLEVAGRVALQVLAWSVKALWAFAVGVQHVAIGIGKALSLFGKASWKFLRFLYTDVLRPAWQKFWTLVDRVRRGLEHIFRPIIDWLVRIRQEILKFYERWIRPILDIIGVARRVLRVLGSLGVEWAKALDRRLGEVEQAIDRPFRLVLRELNRAINAVNRIMTADGLFQRLALVRSIERDLEYIFNIEHNRRRRALTDEEKTELGERAKPPELDELRAQFERYLDTRDGPYAETMADYGIGPPTIGTAP